MGWGYVKMYAFTGEEGYRRRAEICFDWLMENRSKNCEITAGESLFLCKRGGTIRARCAHDRVEQPDRFSFPGRLRSTAIVEISGRSRECR